MVKLIVVNDDKKKLLKFSKTETVIVAGGCCKYIQATKSLWNKPLKSTTQDIYDECLHMKSMNILLQVT